MAAPYVPGVSKYAGVTKPTGNIALVQTITTPGYSSPVAIAVSKELKGGLHTVDYLSQLTVTNLYDGIFLERREAGMGCIVRYKDDGTDHHKLYILKNFPGTNLSDWELSGGTGGGGDAGGQYTLVINNPKNYSTLSDRDNISDGQTRVGTITRSSYNSTTKLTGITGTNTTFLTDFAPGDYFKPSGLTAVVMKVLTVDSDTAMTAEPAVMTNVPGTFTNSSYRELLINPNDFVNVLDARTAAEQDVSVTGTTISMTQGSLIATRSNTAALTEGQRFRVVSGGVTYTMTVNSVSANTVFLVDPAPIDAANLNFVVAGTGAYSQSFVWTGQEWLTVNSFTKDVDSHPRNRDTQLRTPDGTAVTASVINGHINATNIHFEMNDADVTIAADNTVSGGVTSKTISSAKIVDMVNGMIPKPIDAITDANKNKYLSLDGTYKDIPVPQQTAITLIDGGTPSTTTWG